MSPPTAHVLFSMNVRTARTTMAAALSRGDATLVALTDAPDDGPLGGDLDTLAQRRATWHGERHDALSRLWGTPGDAARPSPPRPPEFATVALDHGDVVCWLGASVVETLLLGALLTRRPTGLPPVRIAAPPSDTDGATASFWTADELRTDRPTRVLPEAAASARRALWEVATAPHPDALAAALDGPHDPSDPAPRRALDHLARLYPTRTGLTDREHAVLDAVAAGCEALADLHGRFLVDAPRSDLVELEPTLATLLAPHAGVALLTLHRAGPDVRLSLTAAGRAVRGGDVNLGWARNVPRVVGGVITSGARATSWWFDGDRLRPPPAISPAAG